MKIFNKFSIVSVLVFALVLGFTGPITAHAAGPLPIDLGLAGNYALFSNTAIFNTGATRIITGDVGVGPGVTSTAITGNFALNLPAASTFSTSVLVEGGKVYARDYAVPTPANVNTASLNMGTAYTNASDPATTAGVGPNLNLGGGTVTGVAPLAPGVYTWDTNVSITGDLTLSGSANDVWIFQVTGNLSIDAGKKIILDGGAQSSNIFWRVSGTTTLYAGSTFEGTILAGPASSTIDMQAGAILHGRALGQTNISLNANTVTIPVPSIPQSGGSRQGTINVVKVVVNDNGGTKKVSDFPLFVNNGGMRSLVVSGESNSFSAVTPDVYSVSETSDPQYAQSFSGDCDANGKVGLNPGDSKYCIVTNNDIAASVGTGVQVGIGAPLVVPPVPPLIDVVKVPSPLALPNGPGPVTYTYTLRNIGTVPVTDITMVGDTCSPIILSSGDTNNNSKLDVNETWKYTCSTTLSQTHTNTVTTTGWANGISAVAVASATVIVGSPVVAPLIHVTKIPSPLRLLSVGGMVTYTEKITNPGTVALSNVSIKDDKCSPLKYVSGDTNRDSKLDATETWTYTCRTKLTKTTTNTATVSGIANGMTARNLAIATVVVGAPVVSSSKVLPVASNFGQTIKSIATNLNLGIKGNPVKILQQFLISEDKGPAAKALSANGTTLNFGSLTKAALAEWQASVGITPASGNFGPITRAYLQANY